MGWAIDAEVDTTVNVGNKNIDKQNLDNNSQDNRQVGSRKKWLLNAFMLSVYSRRIHVDGIMQSYRRAIQKSSIDEDG